MSTSKPAASFLVVALAAVTMLAGACNGPHAAAADASHLVVTHAEGRLWTPPGVKHWHGATPSSPMTHIAVQAVVRGKNLT